MLSSLTCKDKYHNCPINSGTNIEQDLFKCCMKEGNVLFNKALNTFYFIAMLQIQPSTFQHVTHAITDFVTYSTATYILTANVSSNGIITCIFDHANI